MPKYPVRPKLFFVKYLKWLIDSETAAEAGADVLALLTAVVKREDDLFYKRAPNYYNQQLEREAGFGSLPPFIATRKRAVKLGLLDYTPGAKRKPGVYFVKGCPNESLENGEECSNESLEKGEECPKDLKRNPDGKRKESKRKAEGIRHPPNPIPIPDPIPNPSSSSLGTPTPKTSDEEEGLLEGESGDSSWIAEKESAVIRELQAAGVKYWKQSIQNCKIAGKLPDEVLEALYIAMNYRDAKGNLVLAPKGFVFWTKNGFWPREDVPTADELRRLLAANPRGGWSPGLLSTSERSKLKREMLRARIVKDEKAKGTPQAEIDRKIEAYERWRDAKTKDPSQCL
jgi:hypothetical protein